MTKTKLLKKLIRLYTKAIKQIEKLPVGHSYEYILFKYNIQYGICYAANRNFGIDIYCEDWIQKHCNFNAGTLWFATPISIYDKEEVIMRLILRVEKMKEILKEQGWFKTFFNL